MPLRFSSIHRLASELRDQLLAKVDAQPRNVGGDGAADPPPRPVAPELGELGLAVEVEDRAELGEAREAVAHRAVAQLGAALGDAVVGDALGDALGDEVRTAVQEARGMA